jgi:ribosomal protein L20
MWQADVQLNRKVLSELAIHEPHSFKALADFAKSRMDEATKGLKMMTIN